MRRTHVKGLMTRRGRLCISYYGCVVENNVVYNYMSSPRKNTSPRTKEAARTIKRAVMKKYAQKAFLGYTDSNYVNIKSGKAPTKAMALFRRMKMFPITVNVPLYRGLLNRNGTTYNTLKKNGVFTNSFSSFTKHKGTANSFAFGIPPTMNAKYMVFILPPGRYPAISSNNFKARGFEGHEIVLAPGKYVINKNKTKNSNFVNRFGYRSYIHLKYTPSNTLIYHNYAPKNPPSLTLPHARTHVP